MKQHSSCWCSVGNEKWNDTYKPSNWWLFSLRDPGFIPTSPAEHHQLVLSFSPKPTRRDPAQKPAASVAEKHGTGTRKVIRLQFHPSLLFSFRPTPKRRLNLSKASIALCGVLSLSAFGPKESAEQPRTRIPFQPGAKPTFFSAKGDSSNPWLPSSHFGCPRFQERAVPHVLWRPTLASTPATTPAAIRPVARSARAMDATKLEKLNETLAALPVRGDYNLQVRNERVLLESCPQE